MRIMIAAVTGIFGGFIIGVRCPVLLAFSVSNCFSNRLEFRFFLIFARLRALLLFPSSIGANGNMRNS